MRIPRLITAPLAAVLTVAALAGPAAAVPADTHNQPNGWYAGKSTIEGSMHSGAAKTTAPGEATTQTPAPPRWPANPQPITRSGAVVNAPAPGFDWGSAGIGAAAGVGSLAIALGVAGEMRRRRVTRPRSLTH
jgi:hypothetical protein